MSGEEGFSLELGGSEDWWEGGECVRLVDTASCDAATTAFPLNTFADFQLVDENGSHAPLCTCPWLHPLLISCTLVQVLRSGRKIWQQPISPTSPTTNWAKRSSRLGNRFVGLHRTGHRGPFQVCYYVLAEGEAAGGAPKLEELLEPDSAYPLGPPGARREIKAKVHHPSPPYPTDALHRFIPTTLLGSQDCHVNSSRTESNGWVEMDEAAVAQAFSAISQQHAQTVDLVCFSAHIFCHLAKLN